MPIFEYKCTACKKEFEELVKDCNEEVVCPDCGKRAERVWSGKMYSSTGKASPHCSGNCKTCSGCH